MKFHIKSSDHGAERKHKTAPKLCAALVFYSGRKADGVKVSVALSNSFFSLGSRWAER